MKPFRTASAMLIAWSQLERENASAIFLLSATTSRQEECAEVLALQSDLSTIAGMPTLAESWLATTVGVAVGPAIEFGDLLRTKIDGFRIVSEEAPGAQ